MHKIRKIIEISLLVSLSRGAMAQTTPSVKQTASKSSCSNIVALSGAKVDCSNLTPAQKKALARIPAILKMAVENQGYLDVIVKRLDELSAAQQPVITNNAPGGFATSGGTLVNPQINNFAPVPRRLSPARIEDLGTCFAQHPGSAHLSVLMNSAEAYEFAMDWLNVFKRAGWAPASQDYVPLVITNPFTGTLSTVHGSAKDGSNADYDKQSAEGIFIGCITRATPPGSNVIILDPKQPTGDIMVVVGAAQ